MKFVSNVHLIKTQCRIHIPMIFLYISWVSDRFLRNLWQTFLLSKQYAELTFQRCQTKAAVKVRMVNFCIHSVSFKPLKGFSCSFDVQLNRMIYRSHTSVMSDQDQGLGGRVIFIVRSYYSRFSLSRIPRDSLKYFEISVLRHIRFAELRKT